jgi:sugar O-acyltransferase (sialic acid O-acetyltransferase NeuD family)
MRIVIFGGGTQLGIVVDIIQKQKDHTIVGIIDSKAEIGSILHGHSVLGRQEDIDQILRKYEVSGGIVSVGDNYTRFKIYEDVEKRTIDFNWVNAIHPSCQIGNNVIMGQGILAMANVVFNPGAVIGDFTAFYTAASIEHDNIIEDFASVSAGSTLGGRVTVKKFAAVTLGCTVFDRVTIGYNSVIGSGSLVTKDVPDSVLAYGVPCKIIRTRTQGEKYLK